MVSEKGTYYEVLYNAIKNAPSSLRIVLLSATPMFDKPIEIALTMNLLKLPKEIPIGNLFNKTFIDIEKKKNKIIYSSKNLEYFKKLIKGRVSYFRGAPEVAFPKSEIKYVKCEMSDFQYKAYKTVKANENKNKSNKKIKKRGILKKGNLNKLPNNFFIGTRMISNVAFPNKCINEKGFKSFTGRYVKFRCLPKYSIKFYKILRKILRSRGTVFVYSNFKEYGGVKSFIKVLEGNGFKDYLTDGEGKKRFAVWSGDESLEIKEEIKAVFNNKKNYNGSKIKVLLGSPSIKEGVSLLRVQSVHIIEPYWNQSRMEQIIGRAIRFCSHKDMPEEHRMVKIYIYIATYKNKKTIDKYIKKLAFRKNKIIKEFELALKESAVDCVLNKKANVYPKEKQIICDL